MINRVYLDHHTATRPLPQVVDKLLPFYKEFWGSTTAWHQMGQELQRPMQESLKRMGVALGFSEEDQLTLTSGGSEAVTLLCDSELIDEMRSAGKNHILRTNCEEPSILKGVERLERLGCYGKSLLLNNHGQITASLLEEAIRPRTGLVCLSWANGLTGVIHPLHDLAAVCKSKGVLLHVDASYAVGKLSFRFQDLDVDFLSLEGQVIHAPKRTGALLSKRLKTAVAGEVDVGALAAFAEALAQNNRYFDHMSTEIARLRDRLEQGIQEGFPEAVCFFKTVDRLPNCCAIGFPGLFGEALLYLLHRKGVYATLGGGRSARLSQVLTESGVDPLLALSAVSFSLSFETTEEEIDTCVRVVIACANQLKTHVQCLMEPFHE